MDPQMRVVLFFMVGLGLAVLAIAAGSQVGAWIAIGVVMLAFFLAGTQGDPRDYP